MQYSTILKKKENIISLIIAFIHFIISFFTDCFVFTVSPSEHLFNYVVCKLLLLVLLFYFYRFLYRVFISKNKKEHIEYLVCKFALPYLIPIILVLIFKLPQGFLSNDETLIFQEASSLADYTWFYYLTTYYYIITMMMIPSWLGPILVKVAIQILVCGYCTYRLSSYLKSRFSYLLYFVFLLFPVLAYTTSAHRIPIYYLLYLFLIFHLMMDYLEHVTPSCIQIFWLLVLGAILTQWRTEGIYMLALLPILLFISYKNLRHKKQVLLVILSSLAIQYAITIPQNGGLFPDRLNDQAENRMGPFYAYTITNMFRNGLDLDKNAEALKKVDQYLSLDTITAINNDLGNINYEDVLILYYQGYVGKRENATSQDYMTYVEGCKNIFINNPDVFVKTRIGAFRYAALPYHIASPDGGIKGLIKFVFSVFKSLSYNLFIPHCILLALFIYSIFRKRIFTFFLTGGLICHWFIVFVLAPASYFKYYFPIYMIAYFYLILLAIQLLYNHKTNSKNKISFLI